VITCSITASAHPNRRGNTVCHPHSYGNIADFMPIIVELPWLQWCSCCLHYHAAAGKQDHLLISGCGVPAP